MSMAFESFELVWGSVHSLRIRGKYDSGSILEDSNHCWVESGNWVYDTSDCMKFRKWFYYLLEQPIRMHRRTKQQCLEYKLYQENLADSPINNRILIPCVIAGIEPHINTSPYRETIWSELELFKAEVSYDDICREMKIM